MTVIVEAAPAKINLTLEVRGRRTDGFHDLDSLVAFALDAGDRLEMRPEEPPSLVTRGTFASSILGENIVAKAIAALERHCLHPGAIVLDKQLPVASGIGGGSADAAALLRAAQRAYPAAADRIPWTWIAASLGADVTACLASRPLRIVGTGTHVEPLNGLPELAAVLVNPLATVPADKTARVFRTLGLQPGMSRPDAVTRYPEGGGERPVFADAASLVGYMLERQNGLATAAMTVVPAIAEVLAALEAMTGCRVARLSGAGPTCFGILDTMMAAVEAAEQLKLQHPDWWVVPTRLG